MASQFTWLKGKDPHMETSPSVKLEQELWVQYVSELMQGISYVKGGWNAGESEWLLEFHSNE